MYTALARRCTRSVNRLNGRVHGTYNAVHTSRKDLRVHGTRPCTGRVQVRDRVTDGPRTWPVHGCVQSVHCHGRPCTRAANTAVTAVYRVHDRVGVPCIRPWTHHVHGSFTPVYTVRTRR